MKINIFKSWMMINSLYGKIKGGNFQAETGGSPSPERWAIRSDDGSPMEENMKRILELLTLEKKSDVKIAYCEIISDYTNEKENTRTRILFDEHTGKYYFHQMKDGKILKCFEIALSWKPFEKIYIFCFTLDDMHVYEIDSRQPEKIEIKKLEENQISAGMKCEYDGMTVEYESENSLKFNGKSIEVIPESGYVFKLRKRKIYAQDGAKGLYIFLENIAVNGNFAGHGEDIKIGNFVLMSPDRNYWMRFKDMYL